MEVLEDITLVHDHDYFFYMNQKLANHSVLLKMSNVELTKENGEFQRNEILLDVASDLADTEVEKFAELTESIEYTSEENYREKVNTLKESYFPKASASSIEDENNTTAGTDTEEVNVSDNMAAYLTAITRGQKHGVGAGSERPA